MPYPVDRLVADDIVKYLIAQGILDASGGPKMNVVIKAGDYTIVSADDPSGTIFTNRGAGGTVIFTLPAPSRALEGVYYDFYTVAAQIMRISTATADTLVTHADAAADSLSTTAAIGVMLRVVCDGTSWIAILGSAIPAAAFAQTGTVAT